MNNNETSSKITKLEKLGVHEILAEHKKHGQVPCCHCEKSLPDSEPMWYAEYSDQFFCNLLCAHLMIGE